MRVLALSDIHGNVAAVQRLREREANSFDSVVVAGDLGNDRTGEIMTILATFACPVLYVFGNWDHKLAYDHVFDSACHHLHHEAVRIGGVVFVGYSGLPTHWGQNPIAARLRAEVESRHQDLIRSVAELEAAEAAQIAEVEAACDQEIKALDARTRDRRRKVYRDKADRIYGRKHRAIADIRAPARAIRESNAWRDYETDKWEASSRALAFNREALAQIVQRVCPARCVVVTHERQTSTAKDMAGVPLFLFGHSHGYRNTTFRGSRFINVSALDAFVTMLPNGLDMPTIRDMRNVDLGAYVVIEIDRTGMIRAQPHRFMAKPEGWSRVPHWQDRTVPPYTDVA